VTGSASVAATANPCGPSLGHWEGTFRKVVPSGAQRVLVATAGFGDGHNRAAEAVKHLLGVLRPELEVRVVDVLGSGDANAGSRPCSQQERYYTFLRTCPRAYHLAYRALSRVPGVLSALAAPYKASLQREADDLRPDVVIATHVFCARAAERLRRGHPGVSVAGVVTDWLDDAYWNRTRLDEYWVASEALRTRLVGSGIPEDRIAVTGIPVDPAFYGTASKAEARAALGLAPNRFTVLVLGGGLGLSPVREAARALARNDLPIQVVVVAGRNEVLRSKIELLKLSSRVPLFAVGFTERMPEYMSAADLAVTKPGGVTAAECLAKGLSMAFLGKPLPGPETLNEAYLLGQELAVKLSNERELVEWVVRSSGFGSGPQDPVTIFAQ
jgi:processive 1,2-diacylglycerol beta-glucosyltransferase